MSKPNKQQLVQTLLERHGRTFAQELGADWLRNTPSPLFQLLCLALLTSAPLGAEAAMRACKALGKAGWKTPARMSDSTWETRVKVLNENGYARYDEKTARQLADMTEHLQSSYGGDLRRLREAAEGDAGKAQRLLKEFKGIGEVGASIFLREAQAAWPEFQPFADRMALKSSARLGLGEEAGELAELVDTGTFPRLVAALVRAQLAKDHEQLLEQAQG